MFLDRPEADVSIEPTQSRNASPAGSVEKSHFSLQDRTNATGEKVASPQLK